MYVANTPRGNLYVVDKRSAINPRAYIGRAQEARDKYGELRWATMRDLWVSALVARGTMKVIFDKNTHQVSFQGVPVNCADYNERNGARDFGAFCWERIMQTWVLGLEKKNLLVFRASPIPEVYADGIPLNYVNRPVSSHGNIYYKESPWSIVYKVWAEGIISPHFDITSLLRISYDGSIVSFGTINGFCANLLLGTRVISESNYALFYTALRNVASLSGLYFMNDKSFSHPFRDVKYFVDECSLELLSVLKRTAFLVKEQIYLFLLSRVDILDLFLLRELSRMVIGYI